MHYRIKGLGKSGTGMGMGIFKVQVGRRQGSRFFGKGTRTGFLSKGGTRIWFLNGLDQNKAEKRSS